MIINSTTRQDKSVGLHKGNNKTSSNKLYYLAFAGTVKLSRYHNFYATSYKGKACPVNGEASKAAGHQWIPRYLWISLARKECKTTFEDPTVIREINLQLVHLLSQVAQLAQVPRWAPDVVDFVISEWNTTFPF